MVTAPVTRWPGMSAGAAGELAGEGQAALPGGVEYGVIDGVEGADPGGVGGAEALLELGDALVDPAVEVVDLVTGGLHLPDGVPLEQIVALPLLPGIGDAAVELDGVAPGADHPEERERHALAEGDVEVLPVGGVAAEERLVVAPLVEAEVRAAGRLLIHGVAGVEQLAGGVAHDLGPLALRLADVLAGLGAHVGEDLVLGLAQVNRVRVGHLHALAAGPEAGGGERVRRAGGPGGVHFAEDAALGAAVAAQRG